MEQTDTETPDRYIAASYHGLLRRASPVLTVTGLVSGSMQFSTPHKIDVHLSPKILSQVISSATSAAVQNLVEICSLGDHSEQISEI